MAINRSAEAMTIFAVIYGCGRSQGFTWVVLWLAYCVFPLPNQFGSLWVNFNCTTSLGCFRDLDLPSLYLSYFWYVGLIPDFRDNSRPNASKPITEEDVRACLVFRLVWTCQALEPFRRSGSLSPCGYWPHHLYFQFTRLYRWTLLHLLYQDGIRQYSPHTSCLERYSQDLRWYRLSCL